MVAKWVAAGSPALKCVLWWQGETDAANGVSQATYHSNLGLISAGVVADLGGAKLMVAKIETTDATPTNIAKIQAAQAQAWADDPNVVTGPDLSDIVVASVHVTTDADARTAASRWEAAIVAAGF